MTKLNLEEIEIKKDFDSYVIKLAADVEGASIQIKFVIPIDSTDLTEIEKLAIEKARNLLKQVE